MSNVILIEKINQLPDNLKLEVMDFVEFLEMKNSKKEEKIEIKKERVFGALKGKIHMSDDFDEPLESLLKEGYKNTKQEDLEINNEFEKIDFEHI
jgi:hypothetical protein